MLSIGNKTFMNLQEAVGWLLENNALPFQSTANYAGNTEIPISTLINPSPAKVRVGSLIFFADSKVSTVVGVTSNSFIVSDQYNDLVDDVVYVSDVALDASGHLIVTLSNGDNIDAGLVKQVTGFSINGSQHLIVSYNDGSTIDLGAIFNGNVSISGTLSIAGGVTGNLNVTGAISSPSIIQTMVGYSASKNANLDSPNNYIGICINGNKLTLVCSLRFQTQAWHNQGSGNQWIEFSIPNDVLTKLYPLNSSTLEYAYIHMFDVDGTGHATNSEFGFDKTATGIKLVKYTSNELNNGTNYCCRLEATFLLSDNLAS